MKTLQQCIQENVNQGCKLSLYHFASRKDKQSPTTHEFIVTNDDKILFALELIIYTGPDIVLYVSKVDTTGCHDVKASPISGIAYGILLHFCQSQREGKVMLQLFARSQPQYIFPYSSQNKNKHVLNDGDLLKWWIKIFDRLRQHLSSQASSTTCHLLIPGMETTATSRYVPETWRVGHHYDPSALAKDVIKSFPDDPKARFLDQLLIDGATPTVEEFWELMSYRQEMASGHAIGFITLTTVITFGGTADEGCQVSEKVLNRLISTIKSQEYATDEDTRSATQKFVSAAQLIDNLEPIVIAGSRQAQIKADTKRPAEANVLVPRKKKPKATPV